MPEITRKEKFLNALEDFAVDFLHYDRINDEDFTREDVKLAIENKEITLEELTEKFKEVLSKEIPNQ